MQQQRRRSGLILGLLALGLLAGVALTAHPAQAADSSIDPDVSSPGPLAAGLGPYYALPSWDRKMGAANRFVVLTDWNSEAVLDKETGLVWEKTPSVGQSSPWFDALAHCLTSTTVGNRKGWRLPLVQELASLIDPSVASGPTLPPGHPFVLAPAPGFYWTATRNASNPSNAWNVNFGNGAVLDDAAITDFTIAGYAWCVRGGNNAEAY